MSAVKKRRVVEMPDGDRGVLSKRRKHTTSTDIKPTRPDPTKEPTAPSPDPLPAAGSTSPAEMEANGHAPKSFQDLGIIQSLCDACTALGYKVHTSL